MLRIKDKSDTTVIHFIKDEAGNTAEEHWIKKNKNIETYYYYYNTNHRLTDIVRFNIKAKRLLPDFLFDYDAQERMSTFTQIPQGSSDYLTWQYIYLENGLKEKELCFNKQKQLVGTVTYTYKTN
jgi:hypothetical protein